MASGKTDDRSQRRPEGHFGGQPTRRWGSVSLIVGNGRSTGGTAPDGRGFDSPQLHAFRGAYAQLRAYAPSPFGFGEGAEAFDDALAPPRSPPSPRPLAARLPRSRPRRALCRRCFTGSPMTAGRVSRG